ncbi:MAG: ferrous iron transport protein A [Sandaracinus sp.]|nr:ferrous iron transport protein A [Myxococcales bacterium]MCB9602849.1 ferrous iron transport protein A [Sandaracinus sp.]MCB9611112.1 ferrous iron transport protein A [Sandaracinus sp.]MCB9634197.1 ferrous iron transport protein A [Sandaracinus sp.]
MSTSGAIRLGELSVGSRAVVEGVQCDRAVRRRLLELGLLPGTEVEVVRRAPLGDPIELSLRGYRLSIRSDEARGVVVRDVVARALPVPSAVGATEP